MFQGKPMRTRNGAVTLAVALCAFAEMASAQEFCVTCTTPDATYRCVIGGDSAAAKSSRGQLLCITELAKSGHHASCSAGRNTSGTCPGELRTVMMPPGAEPMAPPLADTAPITPPPAIPGPYAKQPVAAQAPGAPHPPADLPPAGATPEGTTPEGAAPAEAPAPEAAPQTVEEGLKKAGKAVTDTGNAVGNAIKKTWTCLSSLFGDC
jgi:hypothetical protein